MENYIEYHVIGSVTQVHMKLICQLDRKYTQHDQYKNNMSGKKEFDENCKITGQSSFEEIASISSCISIINLFIGIYLNIIEKNNYILNVITLINIQDYLFK